MEFHKTCRELSIYNFNEILKTNNLCFLLKEYDEYSEKQVVIIGSDLVMAKKIYKEIIYEYSELTFNKNVMLSYNFQINIEKEEFKYNLTEKILNNYSEFEDVNVLYLLNDLGWKFSDDYSYLSIEEQLKIIIASMRKLKTKIDLLKVKYNAKFNNKQNINVNEEEIVFIDKLDQEAISLELNLGLSYSIDTKKTSVSKWISMWNISNKRNEKLNKI